MDRWTGRVALVTGASKGIGAAIVRALVKNGMVVVGCARHVEGMQKTAAVLENEKGRLIPMKCDLTKTEEIESMFQEIKEQLGGVDVCVNNAGVNLCQDCKTGPLSDTKTMYDVISPAMVDTPQARADMDDNLSRPETCLQPDDVAAAVTFALGAPPCVNVRHLCLHAIHDSF
ncbi:dehydrogenase/reductase SDR family member 11-like [Lingula anatina]|uniref:Dehydrogenase/reductase SDR family member 11-like n=1 Tax=Lingula anatina TaxID=7574 RepID=A0A1S3HSR3_LINAN|nr:dehydrogenase/reductase SDR family member 11-like [Lingula anatina]|eukprot:XP_013388591.1 dehydrogenase/reductase SDR family member 11-like [Lingula anatina]